MKAISKLALTFCAVAVFSYADTWSGKLVDANCQSPQGKSDATKPATCEPGPTTSAFALQTADGKVVRLDSAGNTKVSTAVQTQGLNLKDQVSITGTMEGQTIKVDSINTARK